MCSHIKVTEDTPASSPTEAHAKLCATSPAVCSVHRSSQSECQDQVRHATKSGKWEVFLIMLSVMHYHWTLEPRSAFTGVTFRSEQAREAFVSSFERLHALDNHRHNIKHMSNHKLFMKVQLNNVVLNNLCLLHLQTFFWTYFFQESFGTGKNPDRLSWWNGILFREQCVSLNSGRWPAFWADTFFLILHNLNLNEWTVANILWSLFLIIKVQT